MSQLLKTIEDLKATVDKLSLRTEIQATPVVNVNVQEPELNKYEEVWLRAWTACAAASNSTSSNIATSWANKCLEDFKKANFK